MYLEYRKRKCPSPLAFSPTPGFTSRTDRQTAYPLVFPPTRLWASKVDALSITVPLVWAQHLAHGGSTGWAEAQWSKPALSRNFICQLNVILFLMKQPPTVFEWFQWTPNHSPTEHKNGQGSIDPVHWHCKAGVRGQQWDLVSGVKGSCRLQSHKGKSWAAYLKSQIIFVLARLPIDLLFD